MFMLAGLFASLLLTPVFISSQAGAKEKENRPDIRIVRVKKGEKVLFESDRMTYFKHSETVVASGNVHLYYGPYALTSDHIRWIRRDDRVVATGNVVFKDASGNIVMSPKAVLTDGMREGFLRSVSVIFTNNAKLAAISAERTGNNVTVLNKAVYTACKVCAEDPERAPLWQIKAIKITHDQEKATLYYNDATFEVFGIPIGWLPYFQHPDPSVKRQSGLLAPEISYSRHYGAGLKVPYFWNLAPNYDLTFSPMMTSRQGPLFQFEWRHRLQNGSYMIRPTGIREFNWYGEQTGMDRYRGSLETKGKFDLNKYWSWGWDATAVTDDTFLNLFDINGTPDLISNIYLTGLGETNHFNAELIHFRGMLAADRRSTTPLIHPVIDYNMLFADPVFGGEFGLDANVMSLTRDTGADSHRLSTDFHWRRKFTNQLGQQVTPFWNLRGDFYNTNSVVGSPNSSDTFARAQPTAGVDFSWPFINIHDWGTQTVSPIAQIMVRPKEFKAGRVSNEDSQIIEFDDLNLFSHDKFPGLDRVEGGVRANIGVSYRIGNNSDGYASFLFGESFHIAGRNSFGVNTGLDTKRSDFVGAVTIHPFRNLSLTSRVRLDNESFKIRRHELDASGTYGRFSGLLNYTNLKAQPALGQPVDREEVEAAMGYRIGEYWKALGGFRFDIENRQAVEESIGLNYDDECFSATLMLENKFTRDLNIKRDYKISLNVVLKTVGGNTIGTTANQALR